MSGQSAGDVYIKVRLDFGELGGDIRKAEQMIGSANGTVGARGGAIGGAADRIAVAKGPLPQLFYTDLARTRRDQGSPGVIDFLSQRLNDDRYNANQQTRIQRMLYQEETRHDNQRQRGFVEAEARSQRQIRENAQYLPFSSASSREPSRPDPMVAAGNVRARKDPALESQVNAIWESMLRSSPATAKIDRSAEVDRNWTMAGLASQKSQESAQSKADAAEVSAARKAYSAAVRQAAAEFQAGISDLGPNAKRQALLERAATSGPTERAALTRQANALKDKTGMGSSVMSSGMMMNLMFGGWEVAASFNAFSAANRVTGTPMEKLAAQNQAVNKIGGGILGSMVVGAAEGYANVMSLSPSMESAARFADRFIPQLGVRWKDYTEANEQAIVADKFNTIGNELGDLQVRSRSAMGRAGLRGHARAIADLDAGVEESSREWSKRTREIEALGTPQMARAARTMQQSAVDELMSVRNAQVAALNADDQFRASDIRGGFSALQATARGEFGRAQSLAFEAQLTSRLKLAEREGGAAVANATFVENILMRNARDGQIASGVSALRRSTDANRDRLDRNFSRADFKDLENQRDLDLANAQTSEQRQAINEKFTTDLSMQRRRYNDESARLNLALDNQLGVSGKLAGAEGMNRNAFLRQAEIMSTIGGAREQELSLRQGGRNSEADKVLGVARNMLVASKNDYLAGFRAEEGSLQRTNLAGDGSAENPITVLKSIDEGIKTLNTKLPIGAN